MALFIRASTNRSLLLITNKYYNKLSVNSFKFNSIPVITRTNYSINNNCNSSRGIGTLTADYNQKNSENFLDEREQDEDNSPGPFDTFISKRRSQAQRSVLIQVESPRSYADLYLYCQSFGPINSIHQYTIPNEGDFFLVEYEDLSSFKSLIESSTHVKLNEVVPVQSQMLWFRDALLRENTQGSSGAFRKDEIIPSALEIVKYPNKLITNDYIRKLISSKETVSEQMEIIYEESKLQDIDLRLRFLLANQMESSLSGMFPNVTALPFGSTVNGSGKCDSDLDLVINLQTKPESKSSRLVFHTKAAASDGRLNAARLLEPISGLMRNFLPGIQKIENVLHARVPIVKYHHLYTNIECDLSISNMTAVYMSELLYLYSDFNPKVSPLVYTVRQWASFVGLTNSKVPGPWISNFSLTLLVLFYLQQKEILPSIDYLKANARLSDIRIADSSVNCTFLRDLTKWPVGKCPDTTLEDLLHEFFSFYAEFDFTTQAISLRKGASINKPTTQGLRKHTSPLHICNPLETSLNVSHNVSVNEITGFIIAAQKAAALMDEGNDYYPRGLLDIFVEKRKSLDKRFILGKRYVTKPNRVQVSKLFSLDQDNVNKHKNNNNNNNNSNNNNNNRNTIDVKRTSPKQSHGKRR
ncbi:poly(A) RNA polymerase, mitochondrial [Microplitis demolitor]|uniref:poly(A) RNA polymerase, mitochondrial n=1 Tax=Microplitis demolitor TaxID=69319 RepID=UPI00235B6020|nr:poly(A) RNA polymerase, mitochondrial [Microplitis demolitor]